MHAHIGSPAESIPVKLLVDAVRNVNDWHNLGLYLDLTMSQLKQIQSIHHTHGEERIKAEMFDVWLTSYPDASWHKLVTALNAINEKRVAKEVESRYCKQLPGNETSYMHVRAYNNNCIILTNCHNNLYHLTPGSHATTVSSDAMATHHEDTDIKQPPGLNH